MTAPAKNPIRLIVGLGNPGAEYDDTRHNAGFWFVDLLAARHGAVFKAEPKFHGQVCRLRFGSHECWLLKPTTFMNRSGQSVSSLAKYYKIQPTEVLVAHDELDMESGVARLKQGGGHGGHNGLRDIIKALAGKDFWRLRIGIDHPGDARQVVNYVLGRPSRDDAAGIECALDNAERVLEDVLGGEFQRAMNRLHASP